MKTQIISPLGFALSFAVVLVLSQGCSDRTAFLPPSTQTDTGETTDDTQIRVNADTHLDATDPPGEDDASEVLFVDTKATEKDISSAPDDYGQPCNDGSECLSGICIPSAAGQVCALPCVDSCPEGWICQPFQLPNEDPTVICVNREVNLCRPCSTHQDCQGIGANAADRCVAFGDTKGSFCGIHCDTIGDCPNGYGCEALTDTITGDAIKQCVPISGECSCNPWATESGAQTPCGSGDCTGFRVCTSEGLSECSTISGEEICNNADDDCDGKTDEGVAGSPCELVAGAATCSGLWSCEAGNGICEVTAVELCDNGDNDCDGHVDEDFSQLGDACDGDDTDKCANGEFVCAPDGEKLRCTTETVTNLYELCDGLDNDCDTLTDEAFPELGTPCDGEDSDLCPMGVFVCSQGGQGTSCGPEDPANVVEICDNHDNDCNGTVDDLPGGCDIGGGDDITPCSYHGDCYPEKVCANWPDLGQTICSAPCAGNSDCEAGQTCSKLPGSAQIGYCHNTPAQGAAAGSSCSLNTDCASQLCINNACANFCLNESHCTSTQEACSLAIDPGTSKVLSACLPATSGSVITGANCQGNSANCESGHCDLAGLGAGPWYCASLCKSEFDCVSYQECNIVAYSQTQTPNGLPFAENWQVQTHDAVTACYTPATAGGWKTDGTACSAHSECNSYKCFPLIPGDPQNYCTSMCNRDLDCPSNMKCKMNPVNLVSSWLTDPMILTQGPMPSAYTLIRICKFQ